MNLGDKKKPRRFKFAKIEFARNTVPMAFDGELLPLWQSENGKVSYLGVYIACNESGDYKYFFRVEKLTLESLMFAIHVSGYLSSNSGWRLGPDLNGFMISLQELLKKVVETECHITLAVFCIGIQMEIPELDFERWESLFDECDRISLKYFGNDPKQMDPDYRGNKKIETILKNRKKDFWSSRQLLIGRDF